MRNQSILFGSKIPVFFIAELGGGWVLPSLPLRTIFLEKHFCQTWGVAPPPPLTEKIQQTVFERLPFHGQIGAMSVNGGWGGGTHQYSAKFFRQRNCPQRGGTPYYKNEDDDDDNGVLKGDR